MRSKKGLSSAGMDSAGIGGADAVEVFGAALLHDAQAGAQRRGEQGDGGGDGVAEDARAEAAAGHQQVDGVERPGRRVGRAGTGLDGGADRIAGYSVRGARQMTRVGQAERQVIGQAREQAVGPAQHGVLLVQQDGRGDGAASAPPERGRRWGTRRNRR